MWPINVYSTSKSIKAAASVLAISVCLTSTALAETFELTLAQADQWAQKNNPEILQLEAEIDATIARSAGAAKYLRDNPTLTLTGGPRLSEVGRSLDLSAQITQSLEIGGQRSIRVDLTGQEQASKKAELTAMRGVLSAQVRQLFGEVLAAQMKKQLADESFTLANEAVNAASQRVQAGAAAVVEVNSARVEVGRAIRAQSVASLRYAQAVLELQGLLAIEPTDELSIKGTLSSTVDVTIPDPQALIATALQKRGEIDAAQASLMAANAASRLAGREWFPNAALGISYTNERESKASIIQGIVSFELPVFNRNNVGRGVSAARVRQVTVEQQAVRRQVVQEVLMAHARLTAARAAAKGYSDGVVQAMEENMGLIVESYRAGKLDFLELLAIRRQSIEARSEYIDVLKELNAAMVDVDLATGEQLGVGR
jgi:outer membrane protein, heavy metal efflux system